MASGNNYKLLLRAEIDAKSLQAQIDAQSKKSVLILKMQLDPTSQSKFDAEMKKITDKAKSIGKISFSADGSKAVVDFTDKLNQSVKATISLKDKLVTTEAVTKNLAKDARELAKAYQDAEKFLSRSGKMNQSDPKVRAGITIAEDLKKAASIGDIDNVEKLRGKLDLVKTSLSGVNQGIRSFGAGMTQSIKTTTQYALSVGLLYGALNQIRQAVTYVKDLNKALVDIQVLQIDGAKTNEEIASLAINFNDLARSMGATTIEVSRGSTEWLRQGKTIAETEELLKSTLMLSKLGALETAQSTEYLTSIMNGFKMETADASDVVSKLISVDNIAATSAGIIQFA